MTDDLDQRQPRVRNSAYMGWIAALPCVGHLARFGEYRRPVEVAHIRAGSLEHGKRPTGMQERPSDIWVSPLCAGCHRLDNTSQHARGEMDWWEDLGVNPFDLAVALRVAYVAGRDGNAVVALFAAQAAKKRNTP